MRITSGHDQPYGKKYLAHKAINRNVMTTPGHAKMRICKARAKEKCFGLKIIFLQDRKAYQDTRALCPCDARHEVDGALMLAMLFISMTYCQTRFRGTQLASPVR